MTSPTRRTVLSAAATAGAPLIVKPHIAFGAAANSAVSFGIIGTGGRGRYVGDLMAKDPDGRIAAICDKYADRIDLGKTEIPGAANVPAYREYHELLNDKNVDAVLIATPVFLHPEHYEAAILSGKHVYCEKPAGADVAGVKRMLAAWEKRKPGQKIQFGFQQRYSPQYLKAHSYLTTGKIGTMKLMMSYWVLGYLPPAMPAKPAPTETEEQKIRRWAAWNQYSGGPLIEQDCHGIDTINWFGGDRHPLSAVARGGVRYPIPYGDWYADHYDVLYAYPDGLEGWLISIKHTAGYRDVKEQFYGAKGMLETSRKYFALHGMTPDVRYKSADDLRDTSTMEKEESEGDITAAAVSHFFKGIRENKPIDMTRTSCDSTLTAILGRMAVETKQEVTWDEMLRSA
jgi:predicted dehydrogenase